MMSLFQRSNRRIGRRGLIIATFVVLLVVAVDVLFQGSIRALVRAGGASVWRASSYAASAIMGSGITESRRALVEENKALKQDVTRLELRVAALKTFEDENAKLRALVRLAQELPGITAPIVSSFLASPYGTFMIGAGEKEGLSVGDLVVAAGEGGGRGFVIGRISEISNRLSLVTQIFAPDAASEAIVRSAPVVVSGRGGGNARVEAPSTLSIADGDTVVAPSLRGMPIGIVREISREPASAYQTLHIGLPISLSALQFVYVVSTSK